eukprot:jgi/Tetstr1/432517/TSEL_021890.t2
MAGGATSVGRLGGRSRLLTVVAAALVAASASGAAASDIPWPFYHSLQDALGYFEAAADRYPNLLRFTRQRDESSGEELPLVEVTDFGIDEGSKHTVVMVFAEHAREIITTEIALWLTKVLLGEAEEFERWPAAAVMHADNARQGVGPESGGTAEWAAHLLQHVVFKMFPVVNVAGRERVDRGDFCLRTKTNGVDLNRNYPIGFRREPPRSQDYGGDFPFSEPETRLIRTQVNEQDEKPRVYVSVHSGEWALYFPWDSKMLRGERLPNDTEALVGAMNIHCKCMNGPAGKVAGYLAFGSSMDYMYELAHVPYPLTVEVYGPGGLGTFAAGGHPRRLQQLGRPSMHMRSARVSCLREFNPHTEALYQDTVARWVGSFLAMADFLAPFRPPAKLTVAADHPRSSSPRKELNDGHAVEGERGEERAAAEAVKAAVWQQQEEPGGAAGAEGFGDVDTGHGDPAGMAPIHQAGGVGAQGGDAETSVHESSGTSAQRAAHGEPPALAPRREGRALYEPEAIRETAGKRRPEQRMVIGEGGGVGYVHAGAAAAVGCALVLVVRHLRAQGRSKNRTL